MRWRFALISLAACEATLGGAPPQPIVDDANQLVLDTGPAGDASADAPIDARPCTGGDAAMPAPDGTCVVLIATPRPFLEAAAACTTLGATLAIASTPARDAVVRTLAGANDVWIGLTDAVTEMDWKWVDGTPFSYSNWYAGEPNDGGTNGEDCAVANGVRGGQWDDRPCTSAYRYLCTF